MRKAKIGLLAALLAGFGAVVVINEIGISRYPPTGQILRRRDEGLPAI